MRTPLFLTVLTLGLLAWYAAACWLAPFRPCRHCHGMGRIRPRGGLRRRPRPCRWCKTTGYRLRAGRHVINYLTAAHTAERAARRAAARRASERPTTPPRTR